MKYRNRKKSRGRGRGRRISTYKAQRGGGRM